MGDGSLAWGLGSPNEDLLADRGGAVSPDLPIFYAGPSRPSSVIPPPLFTAAGAVAQEKNFMVYPPRTSAQVHK